MAGSAYTTWLVGHARPEKYYSFSAPNGSKARVALPDNSVVWLNAGSSLRYSDRFNEQNRTVELKGEGYFQVAKDDEDRKSVVQGKRVELGGRRIIKNKRLATDVMASICSPT